MDKDSVSEAIGDIPMYYIFNYYILYIYIDIMATMLGFKSSLQLLVSLIEYIRIWSIKCINLQFHVFLWVCCIAGFLHQQFERHVYYYVKEAN